MTQDVSAYWIRLTCREAQDDAENYYHCEYLSVDAQDLLRSLQNCYSVGRSVFFCRDALWYHQWPYLGPGGRHRHKHTCAERRCSWAMSVRVWACVWAGIFVLRNLRDFLNLMHRVGSSPKRQSPRGCRCCCWWCCWQLPCLVTCASLYPSPGILVASLLRSVLRACA